jgi:hypothetical protein
VRIDQREFVSLTSAALEHVICDSEYKPAFGYFTGGEVTRNL